MSENHHELGPELRKLAEAILDGIDPTVRAAAALTAGRGAGTGKCRQIWCPVCALAALVTGEQHPLLTVIADHSVALLEVVRAMIDDLERAGDVDRSEAAEAQPGSGDGVGPETAAASPNGNGETKTGYQPIPIIVDE